MARAPKNGKSGPTETVATTLILPASSVVEKLAAAKRNAKKRVQSVNGEIGQTIATAVEEKHVDRKALSLACQLDAMDDERLHVTYFHLLRYMDDLGIPKRAKAQEEMFDDHKDRPKGDFGDDDKVTPIGAAARKVAEAAGKQAAE